MHGAQSRNSLIYGSDVGDTNRSTRSLPTPGRRKLADVLPEGLLYGLTDNKVGKRHLSKSCNPFFIEEKTSAEARKKLADAKAKDEDLARFLEKRAIEYAREAHEKQKDLEMLNSYRPWGKPGGGAPRVANENNVIATRTRQINHLVKDEEALPLGRPGGGAPQRTDSGRLKAALKRDNEIALQLREGGDLPKQMIIKQQPPEEYDFITRLEREAEASRKHRKNNHGPRLNSRENAYFPFGKPGAGAPLKDAQGNVKTTREPFNPSRQSQELPYNKRLPENDKAENFGLRFGQPGAGAPNRGKDGSVIATHGHTLISGGDGPLVRDGQTLDPFFSSLGRGGAGAPIRDKEGKIVTHISNRVRYDQQTDSPFSSTEAKAKQEYLKTLQKMQDENAVTRLNEKKAMMEPGDEMVSWLQKGVVGRPKYNPLTGTIMGNPLTTSDVTKQKFEIRTLKNENSRNYHDELKSLQRIQKLERERDQLEARQKSLEHVETSNRIWGRPGNGAPAQKTKREHSFDLYPNDAALVYR